MTSTMPQEIRTSAVALGRGLQASQLTAAFDLITRVTENGFPAEHLPQLVQIATAVRGWNGDKVLQKDSIERLVGFVNELNRVTDEQMVLNDTVQHNKGGFWSSETNDALHFVHFRHWNNQSSGWIIKGYGIEFRVEIARMFWRTSSSVASVRLPLASVRQRICEALAEGAEQVAI